jgi:phage baseplate assembly protein W
MTINTENIVYKKQNLIFLGTPYPIQKHPRGFFHTQSGLNQIKSDLLVLLLTNPGERVMLPEFGTPLRKLIFEQGDSITAEAIRLVIINSIKMWEPRIVVNALNVTIGSDITSDQLDRKVHTEIDNIAFIQIVFSEFTNLKEVAELKLQLPLSGE